MGDRGAGRLAVVAAAAAMATVVALQMAQSIGLIGAPPELSSGLQTLYAAQGGTQALDGTLSWLAPLALVALAFTALTRRGDVARLWRAMVVAMVYVLAVFAGAYVMEVGLGYGPTKVWFILGFSMAVGLVAIVPRFTMPPRAVAASLVVLAVGSVVFGGAGFVLSRSWPGPGDDPAWLAGLERVAATEDPLAPRPIACLSADKYQAYFCTRWGAGLSTGLDKPFVDYRLQVMADQNPTATVDQLIESGDVADAKLIVIDTPPADRPWAWKLIAAAGEVYRVDGKPLNPRPTEPPPSKAS